MKRNEFVFTIGYQDDAAIVDGPAMKKHGGKSAEELLDLGLFRPAYCAALYDGQLEGFRDLFSRRTGMQIDSDDALARLFGVYGIPESVTKVTKIG